MAWIPALIEGVSAVKGADDKKQAEAYNAAVATQDAAIAGQRAELNFQEMEHVGRYQEGVQKAGYGGSGVTFTGSPMDELAYGAISLSFKEDVARFNGLVNKGADEASANLDKFLGNQYQTSGYLQAAGTAASFLVTKYGSGGGNG